MKAKPWIFVLLLVFSAADFQLSAQQTDADRKLLAEIRTKAENGEAQSKFDLGVAFALGHLGLAKDEVESVAWFRKAAEQNYALAQYVLGLSYDQGRGVARDGSEAVKWFRRAAERNLAGAQHSLGYCYASGEGVVMDEAEALRWFRKAAEQNHAPAQHNLGLCYADGKGVAKDQVEAINWCRKAAEQNLPEAQYNLGIYYANGQGVAKDEVEAAKWFRKAAMQNDAYAQYNLGCCYSKGNGVAKDYMEAVKWFRKAAEQNDARGQYGLGVCYDSGRGVAKNFVEAYNWWLLAAAQGLGDAMTSVPLLEKKMSRQQIAEGQQLARNFKPRVPPSSSGDSSAKGISQSHPESSGTGFFITEDGYLITNEHVAANGAPVRLVTASGLISARVVKVDAANDLALLKAQGKFAALPVATSRAVKLGGTVATVGFPNIGLQGFAPKLAKGEIAALSGALDDPRYFQISVPIQPGNSGGALVDERGNVVGVVSAKLSASAALSTSGSLPENVNYAVKSSFLLSFLESVPAVSAQLRDPGTKEKKFDEVVKSAEEAAVLVLVY